MKDDQPQITADVAFCPLCPALSPEHMHKTKDIWYVFYFPKICRIAIAYSMGQIIKSVCVCVCVCLCVCPSASTLTVAFLDRFSTKLAQT